MDFDIPALFSEEDSFGVFLLVTVVLGGGAAWLAGRAIAGTWRPFWQLPFYMLVLAASVRFIHFALFGGTFLSAYYYTVDALACLVFGTFGYRVTRAQQMATQYGWRFMRRGLLGWRDRGGDSLENGPRSG
ncbi:MAG TPA: hypothetical protein VFQ27_13540 [Xanthobacteraceae bacterium]|nr:hypothetical protein [Xanthobacteraceae bacterium]